MSSARAVAFDVLARWQRTGAYVGDLLTDHAAARELSPADRRLTNELCCGIVRRRGTLDAVIRPHVSRGLDNIEEGLRLLLHLGAYQLLFLSSVPAHAAVH